MDSINYYIELSENSQFSLENRLKYALNSREISDEIDIDSISLRVQRNLSLVYFYNEMYNEYISINRENLSLAKTLQDSVAITVAASNLGSYYRYTQQNDSSYYYYSKTLEFFPTNEISEKKANALLYISDIQQIEKIYTGAEEDAIKALSILNKLPKTEYGLDMYWSLYNLLAINAYELENYKKSIEYYDKSIQYAKEMQDGFINEIYSINNKANVYREIGEYQKAIKLYEELLLLKSKYEEDDPTFYAVLINNISKAKFESNNYIFSELEYDYKKAYEIAETLNDEITLMSFSLDLSDFYLKNNYQDSVRKYGKNALEISKRVFENEVRQKALLNLSYVTNDSESKNLLLEHIRLSDSLRAEERNVRNKFARIEFDTDQIEAENEQISKENLYLGILSIGSILTALLTYLFISQRAKNRKLKLIQVQQKANEDIYNLMLGQQDKVDEARAKEKIRVSEELHDGVLGRLFGVRLSLDSINFNEGKEAMMTRAKYIAELQTVEQEIRKISHELNTDFVSGSGFIDIVSELIEAQTSAYDLAYQFNSSDDISWDLVSNKTKINIYRIIQESMQNIHKHAHAKTIKISILLENDVICLNISDDGKGFDASRSKKGIGLKNMTSRAEDINGKINFISKTGHGTEVKVEIPYTD
ncbi:MAG: ATP-binding protein [Winogradskyella sp.]|uniref:tetratricopeptide repeat-containing sensor histidine kinase n=1 Tax=Winogradskyella sp. TaxID=1883156 RepID=UPI00385D11EA